MRRSTLGMCALLAIATFGCEQINNQISKIKQKIDERRGRTPPAQQQPADTAGRDTAAGAPVAAKPAAQSPRPAAPAYVGPTRPLADEPYFSEDTGTVAPGMTEREVYALWGAPAAVRRSGEYTYLFFSNGCEYTCGTMDLVTLQNGQVVDAVVRWPGHMYSGQSSSPSPPDRIPGPTRSGDTLTVQTPPPTP